MYKLPTKINIDGQSYNIRNKGDYRVILDVIAAFNDVELTDEEKALCALEIFYEDYVLIPSGKIEEALKEIMKFINYGDDTKPEKNSVKLMDWEQDFKLIIAPVNRVLGYEVRQKEYLHWWTFIAAYYEIGECSFANVISIRQKKQKGKKLDKWEQEFYRENKDIIDLRNKVTKAEQDCIDEILGLQE